MDTVWPGNPNGLLTERIAAFIWANAIKKSDYVIDFHDGGRIILCRYILAEHTKETNQKVVDSIENLYTSFGQGVPVQYLDHSKREQLTSANPRKGSLNVQAGLLGIPSIMAEMGGGLRIWEEHVQTAVQGAKNIMINLGMINEEPVGIGKKQIISTESIQYRSKHGGILYNNCELNDVVKKGSKLGIIKDIAGRTVEEIYSIYDSILTDIRYQQKVNSGDWLYWYGKI
jgi:predicted deacylase